MQNELVWESRHTRTRIVSLRDNDIDEFYFKEAAQDFNDQIKTKHKS